MPYSREDSNREILASLQRGQDVFLVGFSGSGKTYYVQNVLVPFLRAYYRDIRYFEDCDAVTVPLSADVAIVDEVEILEDREFLEALHPEDRPYYPDFYLEKVCRWHGILKCVRIPAIYIITRNDTVALENLEKTVKMASWNGKPARIILYWGWTGHHLLRWLYISVGNTHKIG